ncbi:MAG TPA: hypothetical protein VL588_10560, partial [Bdellovibrionota bacterium]|nr:hypothetical protein [Bdellovibrionota bacterium]
MTSKSAGTQFPVTMWKLKKGAEKRFLSGHPWVYSNELEGSPKGLPPGYPVILRTGEGKVLSVGYGNPHSLIAYRSLYRVAEGGEWNQVDRWFGVDVLVPRLVAAATLRELTGYAGLSARWAFGEADGVPGLV